MKVEMNDFTKHNNEYDYALQGIKNLKWLPWVGQEYNNTKMLILGDSFYEDTDDPDWLYDKQAPRYLVSNQGLKSHLPQFSNIRFFRNIERTVLFERNCSFDARDKFWTSVAYFNLIQRILPSRKSEHRPNDIDFDLGWKTTLETAKILNTNFILKLGIAGIGRLGFYLNNNITEWERNPDEFYTRPFIINLKRPGQDLKIVFINHPSGSRGFKYEKWATILHETDPSLMNKLKI